MPDEAGPVPCFSLWAKRCVPEPQAVSNVILDSLEIRHDEVVADVFVNQVDDQEEDSETHRTQDNCNHRHIERDTRLGPRPVSISSLAHREGQSRGPPPTTSADEGSDCLSRLLEKLGPLL